MSFNTVYITHQKLFPTKFAASTYGICNLIGHLVTIGAPLVAEIKDPMPFIIFVGLTMIASVAAVFLRELNEDEAKKEKK